jgi:hypothetical protein
MFSGIMKINRIMDGKRFHWLPAPWLVRADNGEKMNHRFDIGRLRCLCLPLLYSASEIESFLLFT